MHRPYPLDPLIPVERDPHNLSRKRAAPFLLDDHVVEPPSGCVVHQPRTELAVAEHESHAAEGRQLAAHRIVGECAGSKQQLHS